MSGPLLTGRRFLLSRVVADAVEGAVATPAGPEKLPLKTSNGVLGRFSRPQCAERLLITMSVHTDWLRQPRASRRRQ